MSDSAKKYTIAVIPGDGIGKEVTPWAQKALEKAAEGVAEFDYEHFDLGAERYLRDGAILPEEEEDRIKKTDAILLGAVGDPRIKAGILERGLLLKLRFDLDQYVNLRPSKLYKGVTSPLANPGDIDFVVVREGTEGLRCRRSGPSRLPERGGHRSLHQHRLRRGARGALRLPTGHEAQEARDPRAQEERARQRRRHVAAHRRQGG